MDDNSPTDYLIAEAEPETLDLWRRYRDAYFAKASWAAEEQRLKAQLLERMPMLGDQVAPIELHHNGEPVFRISVGLRKGLDTKFLREKFPDTYAECEKWTHPVSIRAVD